MYKLDVRSSVVMCIKKSAELLPIGDKSRSGRIQSGAKYVLDFECYRYNMHGMNLHKFLLDYCTFVHYILSPDVARQWLSCPPTP